MGKTGCRGAAGFLLDAAVLFLACPGGTCTRYALATRLTAVEHQEAASGAATELTYEVDFLFGRHGISCSNLVEKFSHLGWFDVGRGTIEDPMLTGIGEVEAAHAQKEVASYLASNGLEVDAVQASVLGRAIQTAMLTYPEHAKPVEVVPHMREHARGASNVPTNRATQLQILTPLAPEGTTVNYRWALTIGLQTAGDWDKFLDFITKIYLPDLLQRTGKGPGSRIVIAVTTHSLLMAASPLKATCGHLWTDKPKTNQVVHMKYDYKVQFQEPSGFDVTPTYTLSPRAGWQCQQVYAGSTLETKDELCMSDIGQSCIGPIHAKAWSNLTSFVREAKMHAAAERIEHLRGKMQAEPASKKTDKWQAEVTKKQGELQAHLEARCANGQPAMVENLLGVGSEHLSAYRATVQSLSG